MVKNTFIKKSLLAVLAVASFGQIVEASETPPQQDRIYSGSDIRRAEENLRRQPARNVVENHTASLTVGSAVGLLAGIAAQLPWQMHEGEIKTTRQKIYVTIYSALATGAAYKCLNWLCRRILIKNGYTRKEIPYTTAMVGTWAYMGIPQVRKNVNQSVMDNMRYAWDKGKETFSNVWEAAKEKAKEFGKNLLNSTEIKETLENPSE